MLILVRHLLSHTPWPKAGVVNLTKALAKDLAPTITVNAVAPGNIETDMAAGASPEFLQRICDQTPLKRLGRPEEVAQAIAFLCSEAASFHYWARACR